MNSLLSFLDSSPTSFHAVENLIRESGALPFIDQVTVNQIYYIQKEGSLFLFKTPKGAVTRATIAAAHTDSPALKLKPRPELVRGNLFLLASEVYGAPLLTSWLNRDLVLAGKIVSEQGVQLVYLGDTILTIPQLAPHLDPTPDGAVVLNRQDHLNAILGFYDKQLEGRLLEALCGVKKIIAHDLFLVPKEKARTIGLNQPFIASYRLDNLASCHAILEAFKAASPTALAIAVFWDHEEIGSQTATGALSSFFLDALERVTLALNLNRQAFLELKNHCHTYSIDLAHAQNPNYRDKMEPEHAPLLGEGPVLKWSASCRYATSAISSRHLPPLQSYVVRSNLKGGSTIGPLHAASTGIPTADLGIPQLSMHSIRELIATQDHLAMIQLLKALYEG